MILIGIRFDRDRYSDFRIDEELPLREILPPIRELLLAEYTEALGNAEKAQLQSADSFCYKRKKLHMDRSAEQNGIRSGMVLELKDRGGGGLMIGTSIP